MDSYKTDVTTADDPFNVEVTVGRHVVEFYNQYIIVFIATRRYY